MINWGFHRALSLCNYSTVWPSSGNTQLDFQWGTADRLGGEAFFITLCSNNEPLITVKWIILVPQVARDRAIWSARTIEPMNGYWATEPNRTVTMMTRSKSLMTRRSTKTKHIRLTKSHSALPRLIYLSKKDTLSRWTFRFILHAPLIVSVIVDLQPFRLVYANSQESSCTQFTRSCWSKWASGVRWPENADFKETARQLCV